MVKKNIGEKNEIDDIWLDWFGLVFWHINHLLLLMPNLFLVI